MFYQTIKLSIYQETDSIFYVFINQLMFGVFIDQQNIL